MKTCVNCGIKHQDNQCCDVAAAVNFRPTNQTFVGKLWRLKNGLLYAGLRGNMAVPVLVGVDDAELFDGRDNRTLKLKYYSTILGVKFEVEEICAS